MSNSKWDWPTHMPKMIELYKTEMSIKKIHEAIQCEGFTPGFRIVYAKFQSEGYPTEPAERAKLLKSLNNARWPADARLVNKPTTSATVSVHNPQANQSHLPIVPSVPSNDTSLGTSPVWMDPLVNNGAHLEVSEYASTDGSFSPSTEDPFHMTSGYESASNSFAAENWMPNSIPENRLLIAGVLNTSAHTSPEAPRGFETSSQEHCNFLMECEVSGPHGSLNMQHALGVFDTPRASSPELTQEMVPTTTEPAATHDTARSFLADAELDVEDSLVPSTSNFCDIDPRLPIGTPSPFTQTSYSSVNFSRPTNPSNAIGKPKPRYNRSCTPEKRISNSTNDSGYMSGRDSPMVTLAENHTPHSRSLAEFKRLYRAPCHRLHEPHPYNELYSPQPLNRYKDTRLCNHCQYSGIHNLSWSARYLKLEVFKSELKLQGINGVGEIYDIQAVDSVGNSALHYAAAGGAGSEHFAALIDAGVNPYQLNTAGQLFLHCLRPHIKKSHSEPFDPDLVDKFHADLVNLLNLFSSKGAFRWRDNNGQTALDALALHLTDTELKAQTFRLVTNAGYPLEVSNQFGKPTEKPAQPTNHLASTTTDADSLPAPESLSYYPPSKSEVRPEWEVQRLRQNKSWEILGRASMEPSYRDPETGDNVLHALSRLRLSQTKDLLQHIQDFVSKDVDLNLHNRERDCPLAAFVRERPCHGVESDETGATMSKYLDSLLWKDARLRTPNRINVNMRNREGATALYYAATRARPDSVRSLIEAGANVNARLDVDGKSTSILQATLQAKSLTVFQDDAIKIYQFNNVISYLEHANAVIVPTLLEERRLWAAAVTIMPVCRWRVH